jgi:hypothetical protein
MRNEHPPQLAERCRHIEEEEDVYHRRAAELAVRERQVLAGCRANLQPQGGIGRPPLGPVVGDGDLAPSMSIASAQSLSAYRPAAATVGDAFGAIANSTPSPNAIRANSLAK